MAAQRPQRAIGVGVIGLGFMGRTHVAAYQAAAAAGLPCELVAVCDPDPARRGGELDSAGNLGGGAPARLFDPARVRGYASAQELCADPSVALVSICTYTESHVPLAALALRAGKHVLVEKPVALLAKDVRALARVAARARRLCMPAMCMRFWPGWDWLAAAVRERRYGRVQSAVFQRLGSGPQWGAGFYQDFARSGGALVDLHIHDADFVYWLFGRPARVSTRGTLLHMSTHYEFARGPAHVSAEGAWDLVPTAGFRMRYTVCFERATADFDLARAQPLVLHDARGSQPIELAAGAGYDGEVRHLVRAIAAGRRKLDATLADAVAVAELLAAERQSLASGRPVAVRRA